MTIQPRRGHRREKDKGLAWLFHCNTISAWHRAVPNRGLRNERVSEDVASDWPGAVLTVLGQRLPRLGSINPRGKLRCRLPIPCARSENGAQRAQLLYLLCFRGRRVCVRRHWTQRRGVGTRAGILMGFWRTELRAWPSSRFWVLSHFLKEKTWGLESSEHSCLEAKEWIARQQESSLLFQKLPPFPHTFCFWDRTEKSQFSSCNPRPAADERAGRIVPWPVLLAESSRQRLAFPCGRSLELPASFTCNYPYLQDECGWDSQPSPKWTPWQAGWSQSPNNTPGLWGSADRRML